MPQRTAPCPAAFMIRVLATAPGFPYFASSFPFLSSPPTSSAAGEGSAVSIVDRPGWGECKARRGEEGMGPRGGPELFCCFFRFSLSSWRPSARPSPPPSPPGSLAGSFDSLAGEKTLPRNPRPRLLPRGKRRGAALGWNQRADDNFTHRPPPLRDRSAAGACGGVSFIGRFTVPPPAWGSRPRPTQPSLAPQAAQES